MAWLIKERCVMSGNNRFLLDTNALIYMFDKGCVLPNVSLFYSSISKIELLAYPDLDQADEQVIRSALALMQEITLTEKVIEKTIQIRKTGLVKLPDSLILAAAYCQNSQLVSDDKKLLNQNGVISIQAFLGAV